MGGTWRVTEYKKLTVFVSIVTPFGACPIFILGRSSEEGKIYLEDAMKSVIQNAGMLMASLLFDPHLEEGCWVVHSVVLKALPPPIKKQHFHWIIILAALKVHFSLYWSINCTEVSYLATNSSIQVTHYQSITGQIYWCVKLFKKKIFPST